MNSTRVEKYKKYREEIECMSLSGENEKVFSIKKELENDIEDDVKYDASVIKYEKSERSLTSVQKEQRKRFIIRILIEVGLALITIAAIIALVIVFKN